MLNHTCLSIEYVYFFTLKIFQRWQDIHPLHPSLKVATPHLSAKPLETHSQLTWTKRRSNKTLSYSDELFLYNLTRFDDKTEYKCKVMNYLGFVEASASVTIYCKWMWYRFLLLYKLFVQWICLSYCCKFMVSVYLHSVVPKEKKWLFGCFCFG